MEASAAPKLDFAALSSLLRVISTSPPWDEAKLGMQRLTTMGADGKPYDTREHDQQNVRAFARLVRDDCALIYRAVLCGAYAGRLVKSTSAAERIIRGLQAIRTTYRFEEKSEAGVNEALDTFLKDVSRFYGETITIPDVSFASAADAPQWLTSLNAELKAIRDGTPKGVPFSIAADGKPQLSVADVQKRAWSATLERLNALMSGGGTSLRASIEELMCEAAGVSPAPTIPLRLEAMGIMEWSNALVQAVIGTPPSDPSYVPFIVAPIALRALGFTVNLSLLSGWKTPRSITASAEVAQAFPDLVKHEWMSQSGSDRSVIIIRRPTESLIRGWAPSQRSPVIAVTYDQLALVTSNELFSPATFPAQPVPLIVAVEEPQEVTVATGEQEKRKLLQPSSGAPLREVRFSPTAPLQAPKFPVIVEPRSVDELVDKCFELTKAAS